MACIKGAVEKSFPWIGIKTKSPLFVSCKNEHSEPIRGQYHPKYSSTQIAELHKSFINIADCLEVDPKLAFPIFYNESGFNINIQNKNGDTGIGQLTGTAIEDVDNSLEDLQDYVFSSKKKSCKWIAAASKVRKDFWQPVGERSRCTLMARPWNPLRNLFYSMAYIKLNQKYINKSYERKEMRDLLKQLGINGDDEVHIKRLLLILSYNTGGSSAVSNLEDYLRRRLNENIFRNPNFFYKTVSGWMNGKAHPLDLTHYDFDFSTENKVDELRKRYSKFMSKSEIDEALFNIPISELTFPEFLAIYQNSGTDGYVSRMVRTAKEFQKSMGNVPCFDIKNFLIQ